MKIRVGDIRMVVRETLYEAQRDVDYLKKINMRKIRDLEPDLDPRELQARGSDGPVFNKWMLDLIASLEDHQLPRENRKQFVKWLASNASMGVPEDVNYLTDWINGAGVQISDLPDNFTDAYELARYWHESLSSEKLGSAIEVTGQENVVYEFSDGFKVIELTPEECESEGDSMQHCVGGASYVRAVSSGQMKLFSLRDSENRPHATVSVVPGGKGALWKIDQIKGKQNEVPIEKYARRVREWLKTAGFDVSGSDDYFNILPDDKKRDLLTKSKGDPEAFLKLVGRIVSSSGLSKQNLTKIALGVAMSVVDKVPDPKKTRKLLSIVRDWVQGRASDEDLKSAEQELWTLYYAALRAPRATRVRRAASCAVRAAAATAALGLTAGAIPDALAIGTQPQDIIDSIEKEIGMFLEDFLFKESTGKELT